MARPFDSAIFDPKIFDADVAVIAPAQADTSIADVQITHRRRRQEPPELIITAERIIEPELPWTPSSVLDLLLATGEIDEDEYAILLAA